MKIEAKRGKNKRAQITIFIIIAIVIVSVILVYYLWLKPSYVTPEKQKPKFEGCVEDAVSKEIEKLGPNAGFVAPEFFYMYKGEKFAYLCYSDEYNKPCIVQKPFLKQHFEEQLLKATIEKIYNCYENSLDDLKSRGYDVKQGEKELNISIQPGEIVVSLLAPLILEKESSSKFTDFTIEVNSNIYEVLMVATSLLQFETHYGDADTTVLMLYYPELIIDKLKQDDETTLYIINDKKDKIKFQFASRSHAWAAGYGLTE